MTEQATLTLAAYWEQRVCQACGEPGSDAHHVVLRSHERQPHATVDSVLLLCHPCHMRFHRGDVEVRRAVGRGLLGWPEKLANVERLLGVETDAYLERHYLISSLAEV